MNGSKHFEARTKVVSSLVAIKEPSRIKNVIVPSVTKGRLKVQVKIQQKPISC